MYGSHLATWVLGNVHWTRQTDIEPFLPENLLRLPHLDDGDE